MCFWRSSSCCSAAACSDFSCWASSCCCLSFSWARSICWRSSSAEARTSMCPLRRTASSALRNAASSSSVSLRQASRWSLAARSLRRASSHAASDAPVRWAPICQLPALPKRSPLRVTTQRSGFSRAASMASSWFSFTTTSASRMSSSVLTSADSERTWGRRGARSAGKRRSTGAEMPPARMAPGVPRDFRCRKASRARSESAMTTAATASSTAASNASSQPASTITSSSSVPSTPSNSASSSAPERARA